MKYPQAFPMPPTHAGGEYFSGNDGMTLRDYFAASAIQGLLANPTVIAKDGTDHREQFATWSFKYADAMLEARKWENPEQMKGPKK